MRPQYLIEMDQKKWADLAGRLSKGGKGAGRGVGLLIAAGGLAYGASQSFYTGEFYRFSAKLVP